MSSIKATKESLMIKSVNEDIQSIFIQLKKYPEDPTLIAAAYDFEGSLATTKVIEGDLWSAAKQTVDRLVEKFGLEIPASEIETEINAWVEDRIYHYLNM